eukprot:Gb_23295 [translate_table: standard]
MTTAAPSSSSPTRDRTIRQSKLQFGCAQGGRMLYLRWILEALPYCLEFPDCCKFLLSRQLFSSLCNSFFVFLDTGANCVAVLDSLVFVWQGIGDYGSPVFEVCQ